MISVLPLKKSALADEPGFSVLARNTAINASRTTQEFCTVTGLSKAGLCAGEGDQLEHLANLTGCDATLLARNSPLQRARKTSILSGQKFLTRSLRKKDLAICPQCWLETGTHERSDLCIRRDWLPRPLQTCAKHQAVLVPLPYADYTSCYDHVMRAELDRRWLDRLPELVQPMRQSLFERAALEQMNTGTPMCGWIGDIQIDVLERWCLGLGQFITKGVGHPEQLEVHHQRDLIRIGFAVTERGNPAVYDAVDGALCKHRLRLSKTWLHNWALLSVNPPEHQFFQDLMKRLCADQGQYCLVSISTDMGVERLVDAKILDIAQATNRHHSWVRKALVRDGLLPSNGKPKYVNLEPYLSKKCMGHIVDLVNSLDTKKSARRLNIGIKGVEALVKDELIQPISSQTHKKWRFRPDDIDEFSSKVMNQLSGVGPPDSHDACSIHQACFAYQCTTPQILRFLITGQLGRSYLANGYTGIAGIRVIRSELLKALPILNSTHVTASELTDRLGLNSAELRQLDVLNFLPTYPALKSQDRRAQNSVSTIVLDQFLERFQTPRSAARALDINEIEIEERVRIRKISPVPEAHGLPIYFADDLLKH